MKNLSEIKLVSSFREISNVLDIISGAIRIFAFVLLVVQGLILIRESKKKYE